MSRSHTLKSFAKVAKLFYLQPPSKKFVKIAKLFLTCNHGLKHFARFAKLFYM